MNNPDMLYHFTSSRHLPMILEAGYLKLTESNYSFSRAGMYPVVWLVDAFHVDGLTNGLNTEQTLAIGQDKTEIRFSIPMQPHFERWSSWSKYTRKMKQKDWDILVFAQNSGETHRSWWVSEKIIPLSEVAKIENTKTDEIYTASDKLPNLIKGVTDYNSVTNRSVFSLRG